jgi:hypothetical protein
MNVGEIFGIVFGGVSAVIGIFKVGEKWGIRKSKKHHSELKAVKKFIYEYIKLISDLQISTKKILETDTFNGDDIYNFIISYIKVYNFLKEVIWEYELLKKHMENDYDAINQSFKKIVEHNNFNISIDLIKKISEKSDIHPENFKDIEQVADFMSAIHQNKLNFNSNLEFILELIEYKFDILKKYNEFIVELPVYPINKSSYNLKH